MDNDQKMLAGMRQGGCAGSKAVDFVLLVLVVLVGKLGISKRKWGRMWPSKEFTEEERIMTL